MIYSLNEIDAHCKKAARGAGFEWGYAEDIGKAIRWLATYGLPGIGILAAYLSEFNNYPENFGRPELNTSAVIKANNSVRLCPVLTGAYLCDGAEIEMNSTMGFENLCFPLLLTPYLSQIATAIQQTLTFEYQTTQIQFSNDRLRYNNDSSLSCDLTQSAQLTMNSITIEGKDAAVVGQDIELTNWQILNGFACKTYVPATEASRQGAGPAE